MTRGGVQFGIYKLPDTVAGIDALVRQVKDGLTDLEGELTAKIDAIPPAIKSVQRGLVEGDQGPYTVTISPVNVSKSVVIASDASMSVRGERSGAVTAVLTDSTTLTISCRYRGVSVWQKEESLRCAWQVLEFY